MKQLNEEIKKLKGQVSDANEQIENSIEAKVEVDTQDRQMQTDIDLELFEKLISQTRRSEAKESRGSQDSKGKGSQNSGTRVGGGG